MGYLADRHYRMYFLRRHEFYATPPNMNKVYTHEVDHASSSVMLYINKAINFQEMFMFEQQELQAVCIHSPNFGDVIVSENTPIMLHNNEFMLAKQIIEKYKGNVVGIKVCDVVQRGNTTTALISPLKEKKKFRDFIVPAFHYVPINYLLIGDSHIEKDLVKNYKSSVDNQEDERVEPVEQAPTVPNRYFRTENRWGTPVATSGWLSYTNMFPYDNIVIDYQVDNIRRNNS